MKQASLNLNLSVKKTRKRKLEQVVPWTALIARITPYYPEGNSLLHGEETLAYGDAGYQGIENGQFAEEII